jgi:hypothetical protein
LPMFGASRDLDFIRGADQANRARTKHECSCPLCHRLPSLSPVLAAEPSHSPSRPARRLSLPRSGACRIFCIHTGSQQVAVRKSVC